MQEGEGKGIGGNKRGFEPVASVYGAAQLLERGDLPMRQNRQPKEVNREQEMQLRNHDLRVVHSRRGGAGNITAASTKGRQIRRTGAIGKRRLRRGPHEIQRRWRLTDGGRGNRAQQVNGD